MAPMAELDAGGIALDIARLALALAGLLFVAYALLLVTLVVCSRLRGGIRR
jgi:hypothetical protein